mgnify:FL=1
MSDQSSSSGCNEEIDELSNKRKWTSTEVIDLTCDDIPEVCSKRTSVASESGGDAHQDLGELSRDHLLWNWQKNGVQEISSSEGNFLRTYFKCSQHVEGCKAKKVVDELALGRTHSAIGVHTHAPPSTKKISEEIKKKSKSLLRVGLTAAETHKRLVLDAHEGKIN